MNTILRWARALATALATALAILGLMAPGAWAQDAPGRDTLLAAAREIMEAARYCGLVTFDESGDPRVRTMDPFPPDEDWSIWMGTNRESRKVRDIEADPRVTLYYYSPDHVGYVAVYGSAVFVDDPEEKTSRWKEEWEPLYPDRDAQYLLIHVIPKRLELLNYSRGIAGDPETWEPPSVEFPGG
jgi:general stress protein 26